jgi:hypothetical protein
LRSSRTLPGQADRDSPETNAGSVKRATVDAPARRWRSSVRTSISMSSGRWRSGGITIRTSDNRKNRSERKRAWFTSARRSRLVAATMRTSPRR